MISSEMMQLVQRCASVRDIADGFMEGVSRFSSLSDNLCKKSFVIFFQNHRRSRTWLLGKRY